MIILATNHNQNRLEFTDLIWKREDLIYMEMNFDYLE